jgi:hypothetical protein
MMTGPFSAAHLHTANPIQSTFASVRHRTKRAKGCLSRDGMPDMMLSLGQCAEKRWRKFRGCAHLAEVIQGADFVNGIKLSNQIQAAA